MHRIIFLSIFSMACQASISQKYSHETVILKSYEDSEVIVPYRRMDIQYRPNGWLQTDTDAAGNITNRWEARSTGGPEVTYHNGEPESIDTIDSEKGCKITQTFFREGMSQIIRCKGGAGKQVHLSKQGFSERNCSIKSSELQCVTQVDGVAAFVSGTYGDSANKIEYELPLFDPQALTSYLMQIRSNTANNMDIKFYSLELPQNVARPVTTDARWQLVSQYKYRDKIPESYHFASVKHYDASGSLIAEELRSIY